MARRGVKVSARRGSNIDQEIGIRIRALRDDQKMSQEDLGKLLGVSFQQIQKYEKGTNRVSGGRLVKIAKALHTTPNELVGWEENGSLAADGKTFNLEAYRLSRTFERLPPDLLPPFRNLINTIIRDYE
ncbi:MULTISPECIES: helix-turn-helix domain-containing protein [unclassified Bradyrhizobium]|uniref:helix-turn-helix domain-containing protein n=1 Tax=unclassified Bradyrhizobium TaxID=2631580 RepID=UPI002FF1854F